MATFSYPITVYSEDRSKGMDLKVLVDTGSIYTCIPRRLLESLGYQPAFREPFQLADGRLVESDVAEVTVGLNGKRGWTRVIFGEPGDQPSLGAVTLGEFLLSADPVHQRLVPVPGLRV